MRIGNRIRVVAIDVQGHIHAPEPQVGSGHFDRRTPSTLCRTILVQDKQCNYDEINKLDLFYAPGGAAEIVATAFYRPDYRQRFNILAEETHALGEVSSVLNPATYPADALSRVGSPTCGNIDWHIDCDIIVTFGTPPAGKTVPISTNSISVGIVGTKYTTEDLASAFYQFNGQSMITFLDC